MHDLSFFRSNLDSIAQRLATRGYQLDVEQFRTLDTERRTALTDAEKLKAQKNAKSAEVGKLRQQGQDTEAIQQEVRLISDRIVVLDEKAKAFDETFRDLMAGVPNIPHESVPIGKSADDKKKPLDGRCDVVVSGVTPAARFWTLTLYDQKGRLVANSLQRYGFTSQEIIRGADGAFEIRVASRSRAGNWLPTGGIERYALMLRLYDTPVGVATRTQRDAPMPSIAIVGCP